jgi:DNA-binding NtrC family response regulator
LLPWDRIASIQAEIRPKNMQFVPALVLGEESRLGNAMCAIWRDIGVRPLFVSDAAQALRLIRQKLPDLVVLDLATHNADGLSLLKALGRQRPLVRTVVLGSGTDVQEAVEAMKLGAADYVPDACANPDALKRAVAALASSGAALQRIGVPPAELSPGFDDIVAESPEMQAVVSLVRRVAPADAIVLLLGESGVGKEVIARALHQLSPRQDRDFVPVNCAMLSGEILENELFGHERGAFTSADERKIGLFEVADGGSVLLDEINEMALSAQARLLRVLERGAFRRVGGTKKIKVDLRVIAASNVDLETEVQMHRFREDLYYRLKVLTITVPPLRARPADIPALAEQFLRLAPYGNGRVSGFTKRAMLRLVNYPWPGNVRELKNVVESIVLVTNKERIDLPDLPPNIRLATRLPELTIRVGMTMNEIEREVLRHYLEAYPTKQAVARTLAIGLRTLHAKVKKHGLANHRRAR